MTATDGGEAEVRMTPGARRILDVASELFYSRGIHAVGVDTIAAESGVTKRTLYNRFGSKDGLLLEYLKERDRRWRALLRSRLDGEQDPVQRVLVPFDVLPEWLAICERGCSFINAFAELPEVDHPGRQIIVEEKTYLRDLFHDLLLDVGRSGGRELATQLLCLHEGAIVSYSIVEKVNVVASARAAAYALVSANSSPYRPS